MLLYHLISRYTARNFNPNVATAAKITIAEVEEIVEPGQLHPDEIHVPGIYVKRIVKGEFKKRIEVFRKRCLYILKSLFSDSHLIPLELLQRQLKLAKTPSREKRSPSVPLLNSRMECTAIWESEFQHWLLITFQRIFTFHFKAKMDF